MTVRHALLPIAAVLVLGVGVYLLLEVRAQSTSPPPVPRDGTQARAVPQAAAPAPQAAPQAAPAGRQPLGRTTPPRPADAPARPPTPSASLPARDGAGSAQTPDGELVGPKLDAAMAEANTAYDRGDFEDAKQLASRVLAQHPTNVRMLRIMVSASCIDGDSAVAQTHYAKLLPSDQEQMKIRCARYGVAFSDKP